MTAKDLKLVTELYDAFGRQDLDRIRPAIAADFVTEQPEGLPWSGRYHGPDGFFEFLGKLFSHLETTLEIEQIFDAGDTIVQVGHASGVVRATGVPFRGREVHTLTLREGKLVHYRVFSDVPAVQAALRENRTAS